MPRDGVGIHTAGFATAGWEMTGAVTGLTGLGATTVRGALRSALVFFATAGAAPTARTATAIAMLFPRTVLTPETLKIAYVVVIGEREITLERALVMSL